MELPLINPIQKIAIYETASWFYIIGFNPTETRYRVIKIDRTDPKRLILSEDKYEYSAVEIRELLLMINNGNTVKSSKKFSAKAGFNQTISAFGIVGFVRFLEGYYMILITKRSRVAEIHNHCIFKVEDTSMIYIPNNNLKQSNPDEVRYMKMFQNVDLSSNFYFSYSYDLSHTYQFNTSSVVDIPSKEGSECYALRQLPTERYVWNSFLMEPFIRTVHPDWILPIIHGYIGQSVISVFGKLIFITIIARRSNKYAGTRYLKRGGTYEGNVANEVETEQIVHDASSMSGRVTAYVQVRGSIPAYWSQDVVKMVPKPPIIIDLPDPYATVAGKHFNQLLQRYGAPIIILNLVKKREKKKKEGILTDVYTASIEFLNEFLPPDHAIQYIGFDMARLNRSKDGNVMSRLAEIADRCVKATGFYQSHPLFNSQSLQSHPRLKGMCGRVMPDGSTKQTGLVRVNCVDCLDRTNTAMFALGKTALGYQLYFLGVLETPDIEVDSMCESILRVLYEDQGDTLALQYGGSQLVHRVDTYRKTTPWATHSRDIMHTLSRYYNNTFSDAEKQNTINLFLGKFLPREGSPHMWELYSDIHLHGAPVPPFEPISVPSYCQWWSAEAFCSLPFASDETMKSTKHLSAFISTIPGSDLVNRYNDYYSLNEITTLEDLYIYKLIMSWKDFVTDDPSKVSPFAVVNKKKRKSNEMPSNPSISGVSSTGSTDSSISEEEDDDEEEKSTLSLQKSNEIVSQRGFVVTKEYFPSMKDVYGVGLTVPDAASLAIYQNYVALGKNSTPGDSETKRALNIPSLKRESTFAEDDVCQVKLTTIPAKDEEIYRQYVETGKTGPMEPSVASLQIYHDFVRKNRRRY